MTRFLVAGTAAAALVVGVASASTIPAVGPIRSLAVSGTEVAFAAASGRDCVEIRVWDRADRGVRRYARPCFAQTSTGSGVAGIAVASRRVLWLTYTGGNTREWSLWTATRTKRAPRRLQFVARDVDAAAPIVVGIADEGALPYAVDDAVYVLRPNGTRALRWRAPARVVALSAQGPRFTVQLANGDVTALDEDGAVVRTYDYEPGKVLAVSSAPTGVLVQTAGRIDVRRGDAVRSLPIEAAGRMVGFAEGLVAYAAGRELRILRLSDGRDELYKRLPAAFLASFGRRGIGYASGRRVTSEVWAAVSVVINAP